MIDYDILSAIDNIQESVYDAELEVSAALSDSYTKHMILLEHNVDITDDMIFMESSSGKSLLSKIWEKIKKVFRMIKYALMRMVNAIKRLLGKNAKSVEQIAEECGITPKKNVQQNISDLKRALSGNKEQACYSGKNVTYRSYNDLREIFKNFIVKFDSKGHFCLHKDEHDPYSFDIVETNPSSKEEVVKMKRIANNGERTSGIMMLTNKKLRESYFEYMDAVIEWISGTKTEEEMKKLANQYLTNIMNNKRSSFMDVPIKYADLIEFQKRFNDLFERFEKVRLDDSTGFNHEIKENNEKIEMLLISMIQMSMSINVISNDIMQSWVLDSRYTGACDTFEKMSDFAQKCTKSGIPPKYVVNALIKIAGKKILGSNPPALGQTRVVFFPSDSAYVYKFAYTAMGHTSNINEMRLFKYFEQIGLQDNLASISDDSGSDQYGLKMERLKPLENGADISKFNALVDTINGDPNTKYNVIDIHTGNIAISKKNKYALIDYGFIIKKNK